MKTRRRLKLTAALGTTGLLIVLWISSFMITPLDRPFFLSDNKETIIATHVDWLCNCAGFIDTTDYKENPETESNINDYFFIEAAQSDQDWRVHFIKSEYVRLTGQFYLDKGISDEYELGQIEDKPDHARVFKLDKIEYLTTDD